MTCYKLMTSRCVSPVTWDLAASCGGAVTAIVNGIAADLETWDFDLHIGIAPCCESLPPGTRMVHFRAYAQLPEELRRIMASFPTPDAPGSTIKGGDGY